MLSLAALFNSKDAVKGGGGLLGGGGGGGDDSDNDDDDDEEDEEEEDDEEEEQSTADSEHSMSLRLSFDCSRFSALRFSRDTDSTFRFLCAPPMTLLCRQTLGECCC